MVINPSPIRTSHQEQLVDNWVIPMGDVAVLPLFKRTDGARPEGIIIVGLIQWIFVPGFQTLRIFTVQMQRPRNDLGGYKSTE